jgi:hypothetical protein
MEMLDKANRTRQARAEWRRYVKAGGDPLPVIHDNPEEFAGDVRGDRAQVRSRGWARSGSNRLLRDASIVPTATLGR